MAKDGTYIFFVFFFSLSQNNQKIDLQCTWQLMHLRSLAVFCLSSTSRPWDRASRI